MPLLVVSPWVQVALAITLPLAGTLKAWIFYRRSIAATQWQTVRLALALQEVSTERRSEVIVACAELESAGLTEIDRGQTSKRRRNRSR